nr:twin-arginine translocation (Tat) [Bradyrhizobium sp.]
MERRHFLKLAFGFAAGAVTLAASAQAAPLAPRPLIGDGGRLPGNDDPRPAVATGDEVDRLVPEEVRWGRGRGRGRGWGRRRWGRRRRHWGWHRRRWRRRRRYWRRRYW